MNASALRTFILAASISTLVAPAFADSTKAANTTALNLPGSWTNATVPTAADLAIWDSTVTAPNNSALGGDLSWLGIRVGNVGGTRNTANSAFLTISNAASANTLTLGASGIDMSNAFQSLQIQSRVLIGASQTWNIGNANTAGNPMGFNNNEDLAFQALAAAAPMNFGGNTVNTTGAGQVTVTSGYTLSNGTLSVGNNLFVIQGGGNRLTTIDNTMTLNVNAGGAMRLQSNSGALTSNAPINLSGGTLVLHANNGTNGVTMNGNLNVLAASTITVSSPANGPVILNGSLTGSAALTLNNTAGDVARVLRFAGNNSAYSGTITMGGTAGRATRLISLTAGSAAATWTVNSGHTLQIDGVAVDLGTLNGAGTVTNFHASNPATINVGAGNFTGNISDGAANIGLTKVGSGTLTLTAASFYTGPTNVNGGTLLVTPGALSGTSVTVAPGATFAAQSTFSGSAGVPVTVADGGTMLVRPQAAGVQIDVPSLTVGTATGGFVTLDTGLLGNPTVAPLLASTFVPSGGTKIRIVGSNVTNGMFPGIAYQGTLGGGGFAGLSLELPFRITGGLVDNPNSVDVNITGTAKPIWRGNIDANWDIDSVGDGSTGTPNWSAVSGPNTYVQAAVGTDSVLFDDTATGTTNVNLTAALSPIGLSVNNVTKNYSFGGTGAITGATSLSKAGTGTLTIENAGTNDYTGGTFIDGGTVILGDGATAGAGTIGAGAIALTTPGTLELNRPDDFTLANNVAGTGTLKKSQANSATLSSATNFDGPVNLAAGTLRFTGGGNLTGVVSGAGALTSAGGTLQLSGTGPNTHTGLTTVSAGVLQLNKTPLPNDPDPPIPVSAVGGDIHITGTGVLHLLQAEQIPDTATITFTGSSTSSLPTQAFGGETVANVIVNSSVGGAAGGQFIMGTNSSMFTITNTATVTSGILGVASGGTGTVNAINVTSPTAIVRIAGNSAASTLNVGAGGITTVGGDIQVKFNTAASEATLNLGGDFTTTGNVTFSNGGTTLGIINLTGDRTFSIAAGTTTTVAPDITGAGGIIKTGEGTLRLNSTSESTYTGATTISGGSFLTTTAQTGGGNFSVGAGTTLGVSLGFQGATLLATDFATGAGSTLLFGTGAFGNPTVPVISATGAFNVDGATAIRLSGSALTSANGIPLISYAALGGASGFGGLSVFLPTRMSGTLVNNAIDSRVDLNLIAEKIRWNGDLDGTWDVDPDGTGGTGTNNWRTTVTNTATRYFQGPTLDSDTAIFDDMAAGTTTVNLTTSFTPTATIVDNAAKTYTFTGTGKLTGNTALTKTGTGTLILANSTAYDHTGGTNIDGGVLQVGDGVTPGVGILPTTAVTNNATLALNRPDDFSIASVITGAGTILKQNTNTATFSAATTYGGTVTAGAGILAFGAAANLTGTLNNAATVNFLGAANVSGAINNVGTINSSGGGTISGVIAGAGVLNVTAGALNIAGFEENTYTGLTTVSGGDLRLQNSFGNAVGADILITGAGRLIMLGSEQIPDTATITFNGTSTDSTNGSTGTETVANVIANASATTGQFLLGNFFNVTGTATLNNGILGVRSGQTATLNALNMTGGIMRIAGSSGPSFLNIGPGGITASGGQIQVKFDTANNDATLNLGGNFTATGNVSISNANYTGANLNIINLVDGPRTFDIADFTTTTVAPDFGDGTLIKTGGGTLALNGKLGTSGGEFTLTANGGTTTINETQTITALNIGDGATVILNQDLTPSPALGAGGEALVDLGLGGEAAGFDGVGAASSFGDPSQVSAVPEPGSLALVAFGALGLLRRRARASRCA